MSYPHTLVITPTYNERANISKLIKELFALDFNLSIVVVDDNSPDGTADIVESLQIRYRNLYLIKREKKLGLGSAYIEGFKFGLHQGYDVMFQMDADLSHNPKYLLKMCEELKEYDLVIGSRYVKGGGIKEWDRYRLMLSRGANIFAKYLLRVPINDLTSGFKGMRSYVVESIDYSSISSKGYAFQIEMVWRVYKRGFRIKEYPIIFEGRAHDTSKMSWEITKEAFFKLIQLSKNHTYKSNCR